MPSMQKISPCLWFDSQAEEAAKHYVTIFDGHIGRVARYGHVGQEIHKRPPDSVMTVEFEILNCSFTALNGGPVFKFNEAVSLQIFCDTQDELDRYWNKLSEGGDPKAQECGWLKDKFGLSWQLVPSELAAYPECSRIINEFERPWLLYIAALFHDIAKGRGGDHSEKGTVDAAEFCSQHGLSTDDSELVVWLVRQHLRMSLIAQKEDTHDPEVITRFAGLVGDVRHLQALYLLTHADIRGTSPKVWNEWKGKLLADLYHATLHHLSGNTDEPAAHGIIAERQAEAMRQLRFFALSDTVHERLWSQLDTVYFLRHSAEEIAWHTRALHYRIHNQQPVVRARLGELSNSVQVMVYTLDQPDLFARLAGFFARAGYSVVDAKIHTTAHGYALDSFILLAVDAQEVRRETLDYIEHELEERLRRQLPPEAPAPVRLSRQLRHFPIKPEVRIRPDDKGTQYILSLVAADRPGLLYSIAQTLAEHGVQVHTAKIATLGERAEDVFLVSGDDLNDPARRIRLETVLMERLQV